MSREAPTVNRVVPQGATYESSTLATRPEKSGMPGVSVLSLRYPTCALPLMRA